MSFLVVERQDSSVEYVSRPRLWLLPVMLVRADVTWWRGVAGGCGARQGSGSVCTVSLTSHPYRSHPPHPALFHISSVSPINIGMRQCHLIFITLLILPNSNTYFLSYPRYSLWPSNKTGVCLYLNELPPPPPVQVLSLSAKSPIHHLSSAVSIKLAACLNNL